MSIMVNRRINDKIAEALRGKESYPTIVIGQEALRIYESLNNSETRHLAVAGLRPKVYQRARNMGANRRTATSSGLKLPLYVTYEEFKKDIEREEKELASKENDLAFKKENQPEYTERLYNERRQLAVFLQQVMK